MCAKKILPPILLLLLFPNLITAQNFGGNPSGINWQQINSKTSKVIFPIGLDSQANRINNIVQLFDSITTPTIGNKTRKWNIVLLNQTTIPNAYVRLAPVISELNMISGQNNFTTGSLRWDDNLIIHENRHMQQMANFNSKLTKLFYFFLGQDGQLLADGITIPDYFFEGDAVWQETLVSAQGRGRMPVFFNGFRAISLSNKKYSWMKIRSGSLKNYTPDHYELGYQLVAYGNEKYGPVFWRKVTTDAIKFKGLFYPFNKAIQTYSGRTYKQFRQDALNYFKLKTFDEGTPHDSLNYVTAIKKNTVADYLFPVFVSDDTILVTKKSFKKPSTFYFIINGEEKKIRVTNTVIDDYFSYKNGLLIYASYQSDPRWANKNYSVLQLLNIYTKKQYQITFKSKYFSPDISPDAKEILAVNVNTNGASFLHRINIKTGKLIVQLPNTNNYFFTQTKYLNAQTAISAVRNPEGQMAIIQVNLTSGETLALTPFSYNVIGNPFVKNDTVYYSAMDNKSPTDKIFALTLKDKKIYRLTNNINGIYQPAVDTKGLLLFSAFTADGYRLAKISTAQLNWTAIDPTSFIKIKNIGDDTALTKNGAGILYTLNNNKHAVTKYGKAFKFFNFHSWRPILEDPEYGYTFYSDNILSSFSNTISYKYNRSDQSHSLAFSGVFAGLFPLLSLGTEEAFNRKVETALGKFVSFNSAKINAVINIPLSFVGSRFSKYVNFGTSYNIEQQYYKGIGKNIFKNNTINYESSFFTFSNVSRQAIQNIHPRWAQSISLNYRDAFNYRNSHKLVGVGSFYFPGLFVNNSLVVDGAYQARDTLQDLFSNNFSYSRGYDALSTRRMYKAGVNYHFTLLYPDWGFGNIIFIQRIRANAFYDHTIATARFSDGSLKNIKNRSMGAELYFDTKIWNELPATIGIRFSHLLDINYANPGLKNRWEIIIPFNLIPY